MKIGIWYEFTKEEKKVVRKELRGLKANTGQATPEELMEWAKKVIREALDTAAEYQKEYTGGGK